MLKPNLFYQMSKRVSIFLLKIQCIHKNFLIARIKKAEKALPKNACAVRTLVRTKDAGKWRSKVVHMWSVTCSTAQWRRNACAARACSNYIIIIIYLPAHYRVPHSQIRIEIYHNDLNHDRYQNSLLFHIHFENYKQLHFQGL